MIEQVTEAVGYGIILTMLYKNAKDMGMSNAILNEQGIYKANRKNPFNVSLVLTDNDLMNFKGGHDNVRRMEKMMRGNVKQPSEDKSPLDAYREYLSASIIDEPVKLHSNEFIMPILPDNFSNSVFLDSNSSSYSPNSSGSGGNSGGGSGRF